MFFVGFGLRRGRLFMTTAIPELARYRIGNLRVDALS
jgi:hypothetical protein